jgi:hypothetical protein
MCEKDKFGAEGKVFQKIKFLFFYIHHKIFVLGRDNVGAGVQRLDSDEPNEFHETFTNLIFHLVY